MCHLLLLLPLIVLPVFWLLPLYWSVPIYAVTVVVAGTTYALAIKAMRLPAESGDARLRESVGTVESVEPRGRCRIDILGELWRGDCQEPVNPGDKVRVTGRNGLMLHVEKLEGPLAHGE